MTIRLGRRRACAALLAAFGLALASAAATAATAAEYPTRVVRIVVPYPAGGGADVLGRLLADKLSQRLGQQFIIDNRTGAAGVIGAETVARAPADGYTLLLSPSGPVAIAEHLKPAPPYDAARAFAPIALLARQPLLFVVNAAVPAPDIKALLALAKARPGALNFGSPGIGTENHLTGELLKKETGVDITHVPYRGGGPAITALLGGEIEMMVVVTGSIRQHVRDGRVRALATTAAKRLPELPEVPTTAEMGMPGVDGVASYGLLAPAGTPVPIVATLEQAVLAISADPDYRAKLEALAVEVAPLSTADYTAMISRERKSWGEVIRFAKLDAEP